MNTNISSVGIDVRHRDELGHALERLRREHQRIRELIHEIEYHAKTIQHQRQWPSRKQLLELVPMTEELIRELERHADWEAEQLFPFIRDNITGGPSCVTSLWMLEKEHQLADAFFESFYKELETGESDLDCTNAHQALNQLFQACRIVREHLESEEDVLLPLLEQGEASMT